MRYGVAALVGVCAWLATGPAEAQQWPPPAPGETDHVVFGELGFGTSADEGTGFDANVTVFSPVLGGRFAVADRVELAFLWGFSNASGSVNSPFVTADESAFQAGNPYLQGNYRLELEQIELRLGAGLTFPVANVDSGGTIPEQLAEGFALYGAAAIRGAWNAWLWAPTTFSIVPVVARVDSDPEQSFHFAGELAFAILIDAGDNRDGTSVLFQTAGEAGGRFGGQFIVGGRLQVVAGDEVSEDDPVVGTMDEDNAQISIAPFFRWEGERGFFNVRLLMNMDEPAGFSFDGGILKFWGLHVGGGGRL